MTPAKAADVDCIFVILFADFPSVPVQNVSLDHVDVLWCRRFVTVDVL
jgi:hypothetical protein